MNAIESLEFGVGYINGGEHRPIHSAYSAQKVVTGLSQVGRMMQSDSPEMRSFASYWLDAISFKLQKEASFKKTMGEWTLEDAQEHNAMIERIHKIKEEEIRANLEEPMSEEEMPEFVLKEYKKHHPGNKAIDFLITSINGKGNSSPDDPDELLGFHDFVLNIG